MSDKIVYARRRRDPEFLAAWNEAANIGTEMLEQEAQRRAFHGTKKPVFYKGEQCGEIQEYSDTLLMFLLRGRKPEMYRDNHGDTGTVPTQVNITVVNIDTPKEPTVQVVEQAPPDVSAEAKAAYAIMRPPEIGVSIISEQD